MIEARSVEQCRAARSTMGEVAFVPTMGALHEGHLELIREARGLADRVVVSIFVNPTQFAPHEDLDRYPRPIEEDLRRCRELGVDLVFRPCVEEIYPPDGQAVRVEVPELGGILEGAHRPQFFGGVCGVVAKLFNIVEPNAAVFGMKDYQQLRVVEAMASGLNFAVRIVPVATVREPDGLAMSSRNVYLEGEQRERALALSRALAGARRMIEEGAIDPEEVEGFMRHELEVHELAVDYAVVRDAWTLQPVDMIGPADRAVVCLIAAWVGAVRLIDNVLVGGAGSEGVGATVSQA